MGFASIKKALKYLTSGLGIPFARNRGGRFSGGAQVRLGGNSRPAFIVEYLRQVEASTNRLGKAAHPAALRLLAAIACQR